MYIYVFTGHFTTMIGFVTRPYSQIANDKTKRWPSDKNKIPCKISFTIGKRNNNILALVAYNLLQC